MKNFIYIYNFINSDINITFFQLAINPTSCQDKSDQVFTVHQPCTEEEYVDKYEKLICSGDNNVFTQQGSTSLHDYCHRIDDIMRDHNTSDYWDPHKCRDSCQHPGYGCRACSNPDYFRCTKNNISVCIHPDLRCNLHPDCDNAEDEKFKDCKEPYVEKKLIENFATLRCTSIIYPNSPMETIATVCDGITECSGGLDEPSSCKRSGGSNRVLGLSVGSILVFYLTLLFYSKLKKIKMRKRKTS